MKIEIKESNFFEKDFENELGIVFKGKGVCSPYNLLVRKNPLSITVELNDNADGFTSSIYTVLKSFEPTGFQVQTTSYGSLDVEEISNLIRSYEVAQQTVEELNIMFNF